MLYRQECEKSDAIAESRDTWRKAYFKAKDEIELARAEINFMYARIETHLKMISEMSEKLENIEKKKKVAVKKKKTSNESIKRKK